MCWISPLTFPILYQILQPILYQILQPILYPFSEEGELRQIVSWGSGRTEEELEELKDLPTADTEPAKASRKRKREHEALPMRAAKRPRRKGVRYRRSLTDLCTP